MIIYQEPNTIQYGELVLPCSKENEIKISKLSEKTPYTILNQKPFLVSYTNNNFKSVKFGTAAYDIESNQLCLDQSILNYITFYDINTHVLIPNNI